MSDDRCPVDCGDSACECASERGGMRTNGGCRCGAFELRRALLWWRAEAERKDRETPSCRLGLRDAGEQVHKLWFKHSGRRGRVLALLDDLMDLGNELRRGGRT